MANKIILKKSSVASKVPLATDLEIGEVAVNLADQKLYSKNSSGTVVLVGSGTITSSQVTTALGYTPYNSTNPSGYITSSGSITGSAATLTTSRTINEVGFNGSANITIPRVRAIDDRTTAPGDGTAGYATFGFGSWANNNTSPFADYWIMRSYSDSSGGSDNMVAFRKDALGVRIWQQTYGSATAFTAYKDVCWTDGTNASGTWGISVSGSAATLTTGRTIGMTGDVTWTSASFNGSANVTGTATLANSGATAGTYKSVTVDAKGRVTAGTNPTTLSGYGITDALPISGGNLTGGLKEALVAMGTNDININSGNYFTKTISGATTFTVSNVPSTGIVASFILELTNPGSATITWWANVKWAGGSAPSLTASGRDILGFYTHNGGTIWNGLVLAKDVK